MTSDKEPPLLTKDQLLEAAVYVAMGGLAAISATFAVGVTPVLIVFIAILTLILAVVILLNAVRRWRWRRRRRAEERLS